MRKSWLLWLLTTVFVWFLVTHLQELEQLGRTVAGGHWQWLLVAFGLQLLYYIAYTSVYQFAFATVEVQSSLWELLPVTYASLFANLAAPTGGMAGAALFVEEVTRRGQSRIRATVGVLLMLVIDFGVLNLIILASLGVLWVKRDLKLYEVGAALVLFLFVGGMGAALLFGLWRPLWLRTGCHQCAFRGNPGLSRTDALTGPVFPFGSPAWEPHDRGVGRLCLALAGAWSLAPETDGLVDGPGFINPIGGGPSQ